MKRVAKRSECHLLKALIVIAVLALAFAAPAFAQNAAPTIQPTQVQQPSQMMGPDTELVSAIRDAKTRMVDSAKEIELGLKEKLGYTSTEAEIKNALADFEKGDMASPENQKKFIDRLYITLEFEKGRCKKALDSGLAKKRELVITGYETLVERLTSRAEAATQKAEAADPETAPHYRMQAESFRTMAKAYALSADQFKKLDIPGLMKKVQSHMEVVNDLQPVLLEIRDCLAAVGEDEKVIQQLKQFVATVDAADNALSKFSKDILMVLIEQGVKDSGPGKAKPADKDDKAAEGDAKVGKGSGTRT